jgi:hypothetical protein
VRQENFSDQEMLNRRWRPALMAFFLRRVRNHTGPIIPRHQLTIQSGSVDWFKFWLLGERDPAPLLSDQYDRWAVLCHKHLKSLSEKQAAAGFLKALREGDCASRAMRKLLGVSLSTVIFIVFRRRQPAASRCIPG